ncbi:MAG: hypothetical protein EP330_09255 [Deltaproteobacteria bacterium]|nr:MAG: hypothetical protein EP330_09255 [Deltaproteobacteria bacterium]
MASWDDVREHMRKNFKLQQDEHELVSMVWSYEDGRHQKIILRHYQAFDRGMIEFKSAFGRAADANPLELIRKNAELPLATIALHGDVYVVVYNVVLDHLDMGDLELYLSTVAGLADKLEEEYAQQDEF